MDIRESDRDFQARVNEWGRQGIDGCSSCRFARNYDRRGLRDERTRTGGGGGGGWGGTRQATSLAIPLGGASAHLLGLVLAFLSARVDDGFPAASDGHFH